MGMALAPKGLQDIDRLLNDLRLPKFGLGVATIFISFSALIR